MPNKAPAKVQVSPNATSTLLSITPKGLTIKPAISKPQPTTTSIIADINYIFNLVSFFILY